MQKPDWWPKNPYPESIFPMPEEWYPEIVEDSELRTALSGMLGRRFWDIASDAIWEAMFEAAGVMEEGSMGDTIMALLELVDDLLEAHLMLVELLAAGHTMAPAAASEARAGIQRCRQKLVQLKVLRKGGLG